MDKVILVGGGTGGHCIPMVSLYKKFSKLNVSCLIITDKRGSVFFNELNQNDVIVLKTPTKTVSMFQQLLNFPIIYLQVLLTLLRSKDSHVLGFGGFITLPVLFCANNVKINTSIHEANAIIGKANRILAKNASNIFLTFDKTKMLDATLNSKVHNVGLPLREDVVNLVKIKNITNRSRYVISVIGGSQGSYSLSNEVPMALIKFSKKINNSLFIYHQCRKEDVIRIRRKYRAFGVLCEVSNYFYNMPNIISKSNLIISRSGSSTLNEIIYTSKPSILIPFPFAVDDHQHHNANILKKISCAKLINNADLTSNLLLKNLLRIFKDPDKIIYISQKLRKITHKNTSLRMLKIIQNSNAN